MWRMWLHKYRKEGRERGFSVTLLVTFQTLSASPAGALATLLCPCCCCRGRLCGTGQPPTGTACRHLPARPLYTSAPGRSCPSDTKLYKMLQHRARAAHQLLWPVGSTSRWIRSCLSSPHGLFWETVIYSASWKIGSAKPNNQISLLPPICSSSSLPHSPLASLLSPGIASLNNSLAQMPFPRALFSGEPGSDGQTSKGNLYDAMLMRTLTPETWLT